MPPPGSASRGTPPGRKVICDAPAPVGGCGIGGCWLRPRGVPQPRGVAAAFLRTRITAKSTKLTRPSPSVSTAAYIASSWPRFAGAAHAGLCRAIAMWKSIRLITPSRSTSNSTKLARASCTSSGVSTPYRQLKLPSGSHCGRKLGSWGRADVLGDCLLSLR